MPHIKSIQKLVVPSKSNEGDGITLFLTICLLIAMSALVVSLDLIMKYCKKLKFIKNIVLITDALGHIDWSGSEEIAQQINAENINLSIL